jgi:ribosomal protein S9
MPSYSKILKFKVMKPLVHAGEKASLGDFDVELEVDSGGSDDSELKKLLLKV